MKMVKEVIFAVQRHAFVPTTYCKILVYVCERITLAVTFKPQSTYSIHSFVSVR